MLDSVSLGGGAPTVAPSPAASKTERQAVVGAFARELGKRTSSASTGGAAATDTSGLKTEAVPGHSYVKVTEGAEAGRYRNDLATSPRHGELFTIAHRGGRTLHVYGQGDHRTVIALAAKDAAAGAATTPATTTAAPSTSVAAAATPVAAAAAPVAATATTSTTDASAATATTASPATDDVLSAVTTGTDGDPLATS